MQLLKEFMDYHDEWNLLLEKLGNLSQLKVGKMIDVLKQTVTVNQKKQFSVSPNRNKFKFADWRNAIGSRSEIVDGGYIDDIADLRRAYKLNDTAKAFALYVDNTAIVFATFNDHDLAGATRGGIVAYDLTSIEAAYTASRKNIPAHQSVDKKEKYSYAGMYMKTSELKDFISDIKSYIGRKRLACKLVLWDSKSADISDARKAVDKDTLTKQLETITKKLRNHKISKNQSVSTIKEFIRLATIKKFKEFHFDGRIFSTDGWESNNQQDDILAGKPYVVTYRNVDEAPTHEHKLILTYKYLAATNSIICFKAEWEGKEDGKKITRVAVLNEKTHFKQEHGISDPSDKDEVLKSILTLVKDGELHKAKAAIADIRKRGQDYPEFKTIEKIIADQ